MEIALIIAAFIWTAIFGNIYISVFRMSEGWGYILGFFTPFIAVGIYLIVSKYREWKGKCIDNGLHWTGPSLDNGNKTWFAKVEKNTQILAVPDSQTNQHGIKIGTISSDSNAVLHVFTNRFGNLVEIGRVDRDDVIFDNTQIVAQARQQGDGRNQATVSESVAVVSKKYIISTLGSRKVVAKVYGDERLAGAAFIALMYSNDSKTPYHHFWEIPNSQWSARQKEL